MNITVRQIAVEDRSSWLELYHAYLKFYESEPVESSTELLWNRLTKAEPKIQGLVAESNGEIVGIAHFHYQLSTWSDTLHCYLEDLYVSEEARGKGLATALIAEVRKFAIEHECSELFWITKESNQTARKLYEKVAAVSDFVRYEIRLED
ncbi:MAG: GNAT family N-acetyltransferase [Rhodoluna sp.]|nr:GNAT family N-acetyltransferase [Rhodoluna sp.]